MTVKRRRLTDANVARLAPAAREYTVWIVKDYVRVVKRAKSTPRSQKKTTS